ncbi:hypothetical protein B9Z55_000898 [Caenorhabditis nigoni]|uniref:Uncharacterized protein n=1 Tax=Caenorhabditis nigoni TaxID=1611254 RepID=A0A2G5VVF7_9PELO|nr:hypothetical protein B9Z55_000898 [Caenorhabditis nigoni]
MFRVLSTEVQKQTDTEMKMTVHFETLMVLEKVLEFKFDVIYSDNSSSELIVETLAFVPGRTIDKVEFTVDYNNVAHREGKDLERIRMTMKYGRKRFGNFEWPRKGDSRIFKEAVQATLEHQAGVQNYFTIDWSAGGDDIQQAVRQTFQDDGEDSAEEDVATEGANYVNTTGRRGGIYGTKEGERVGGLPLSPISFPLAIQPDSSKQPTNLQAQFISEENSDPYAKRVLRFLFMSNNYSC